MNRDDIIWLAGLLEGEGSFIFGGKTNRHKVRICLAMTDKDVVEKVALLFGTKCTEEKRNNKPEHYRQCWRTVIQGGKAVEVMKSILPWMGQRRSKRINDLIQRYEDRPIRHYEPKTNPDLIKELVNNGMSYRQIEILTGCGRTSVYRIVHGKNKS